MARIGLATSPLPRECSTTEPHGPTQTGAGEGDRTLVVSLENFCSTIELHPHALPPNDTRPSTQTRHPAQSINQSNKPPPDRKNNIFWWREKDSNLRRQSRQIYSLIPLTARESLQTELAIIHVSACLVKDVFSHLSSGYHFLSSADCACACKPSPNASTEAISPNVAAPCGET